MSDTASETQAVVVERDMNHPPEKVWRALTQPHLIEEWLTKTDLDPVVDRRFSLDFDWGVVDCQVRVVEPQQTLSYTWDSGAMKTVVTWTLTPTDSGTHLRMEQTGFRPGERGQGRFFHGARAGWPRLFDGIETVLAKLD